MNLTTVQEIERAIDALTPEQREELCHWLDAHYKTPPAQSDTRTGADLIAALQASPCRDVEIEPERYRLPVRDIAM
jgi:hypothetical protein